MWGENLKKVDGKASSICKSPDINTCGLPVVVEPNPEIRPEVVGSIRVRNLELMAQQSQPVPENSDDHVFKKPLTIPSQRNKLKRLVENKQLGDGTIQLLPPNEQQRQVNFCEHMVSLPNETINCSAANGDICVESGNVRDSCDVPSICCVGSLRDFVEVASNCCEEPVDVPNACCDRPVSDLSDSEVVSCLSSAKRLKQLVKEQSKIAEPQDDNLPKGCEQKIVCPISKTVLDIHNNFLSSGKEPIECWEDICELSDGLYESFFNLSRVTMRKLLDLVKEINYDSLLYQNILSHMSIDQLICFSVRYLAKNRNIVDDSFHLFNVPPERADEVLEKGFNLISKLRDVVIKKPDRNMWEETRNYNLAEYHISSAGALGHHIFVTEKEEVLLTLVICNEKSMFTVVDVGSELRIPAALELSDDLQDAINSLPENCYLIASHEFKKYIQWPVKILTPLPHSDDWQLQDYNEALCKAHNVLHCFEETRRIFPRLNCLHRALPEAVVSALVLYNLSILCKDLS